MQHLGIPSSAPAPPLVGLSHSRCPNTSVSGYVSACRLMKGDGKTSLHIGLGAGVAANALSAHGASADVIELQPEVRAPDDLLEDRTGL